MITHPSFAELNEYADRELSESRRARVSTHLAKCSDCRGAVMSLRAITKEAPEILNVGAPAGALERILDRHAKGESVILPVADPPPQVFVRAAVWRAAAVLALLAASVATVFRVGELGAEFSELTYRPVDPTNRTVEIEYRGTSMFADEDRLVVRASYRVPGDEFSMAQNRKFISATLYRHGDGLFRGLLELPDSAVFATFAVEDKAGELVDSHSGALWEVLVKNAGIPLYDALVQKQQEWIERNGARALSTAQLATTLYPDNPYAWARVHFIEQIGTAEANLWVLNARHASRFAHFERDYAGKSLTGQQLAGMYGYALGLANLGLVDADRLHHWRNRLMTEAPSHPAAVQAHVFVITETRHPDRPDLALEELEEIWQAYPYIQAVLPRNGFRQALKTGVPADIQRWADRRQDIEPWASVNIAVDLLQIPALKTNAMMRLREQLAQWDADARQNRALQSTAREGRIRFAALRRRVLTALGEALVQMGQPVAAVDTLGLAIIDGWDAAAFRAMANAHFALGDTTSAITMLARVAADPNTAQTEVKSIETVGRSALGESAWEMLRDGAVAQMLRNTIAESVNRGVVDDVELTGTGGERYRLDALTRGHVTLVAYLTRFCQDCGEHLEHLEEISARLRATAGDFVDVFVIFAEPPTAETRQFVARYGIALPVFHDESRVAYAALEFWDMPGYTLLDSAGRARYIRTDLADVPRQVAALLSRDGQ